MPTISNPNLEKRVFKNAYDNLVTLQSVKTVSVTKTRPNNTTPYTAGDVVNEDAASGTNWTLENAAYREGGEGVITKAMVIDSSDQSALYPDFELFLFSVAPTADNDNAAFSPTDAEMLNLIGVIDITNSYAGSGNSVHISDDIRLPFNCASGDANIYGVLVVRNAYVPTAQEVFKLVLNIE